MNLLGQREEVYNHFKKFESPLLAVTATIETKNFLLQLKEEQISPFQWILYCLVRANLEIPNFRLRYFNEEIYEVKTLVPSYTVMRENGVFNYAKFRTPEDLNFKSFLELSLKAKDFAEKEDHLMTSDFTHHDYIFVTCMPKINFTSVTHPLFKLNNPVIPCYAIGKFNVSSDKKEIKFPLGIQAHHSFVDGLHLSDLIEKFQEFLVDETFKN